MFPHLDFHELQLTAAQFYLHKKYLHTHTENIGRSRTVATPKIKLLMVILNNFQTLTITTKSFIRGDTTVLDLHLGNFSEKYIVFFSPNHRKAGKNKHKSLFF